MREIKFRVWDNEIGSFVGIGLNVNECNFSDGVTFQQYTGLKDKNGKEIYEGDIIQLEGAPYLYEIVWDSWKLGIDSHGIVSDDIQGFTSAVQKRAIIVGNIKENADLL